MIAEKNTYDKTIYDHTISKGKTKCVCLFSTDLDVWV